MRSFRIGLVAVVGALALTGCGSPEPASSVVRTNLLAFEPEKLTVTAGTSVTWEVGDALAHTVTTGTFTIGGDGLRSSERPDGTLDLPLAKGKPVTFRFDKPGTYIYYCSIHKGMTGEVDVTP